MSAIQDTSNAINKEDSSNESKNNNEEPFYNNYNENLTNNPALNPTSIIRNHIISFIFEIGNIPQNSLVWDLGCGTGVYLQPLLNNEKVKTVVGSDVDNKPINYINKNKKPNYINKNKLILQTNNSNNLNWNQKNINKYGKINLLFTSMALHHIKGSNRNKLLNDIYNNLTDNGIFVILDISPKRAQIMGEGIAKLNIQNSDDKNKHSNHQHDKHHHNHKHGDTYDDENKQDDDDDHDNDGDSEHHDPEFKSLEDTIKELEEKQFKHFKSFDLSEKSDDWKKSFDQHVDSEKMKKYLEKENLKGYFIAMFTKNKSK